MCTLGSTHSPHAWLFALSLCPEAAKNVHLPTVWPLFYNLDPRRVCPFIVPASVLPVEVFYFSLEPFMLLNMFISFTNYHITQKWVVPSNITHNLLLHFIGPFIIKLWEVVNNPQRKSIFLILAKT